MNAAQVADQRRQRTVAVEGEAQSASVTLSYLNLPP